MTGKAPLNVNISNGTVTDDTDTDNDTIKTAIEMSCHNHPPPAAQAAVIDPDDDDDDDDHSSSRRSSPPPPSPPPPPAHPTTSTTIVDEAEECLAQSLLMFLYADLRLLSATGRINTKFETLCIDSDRVPRTSAANMAQLVGCDPVTPSSTCSSNNNKQGVSPGQIMAILLVELRQELFAQRRRAKEAIKRRNQEKWVRNPLAPSESEDDDENGEESEDDDDAGVMNKITDRKGRKEFETDMHTMIRSYNAMLAQDLKGIPDVKVERMFTNPLRSMAGKRPYWTRTSQATQRWFSFDETEGQQQAVAGGKQDSDDEGSKKSEHSAAGKFRNAARAVTYTAGALMRKHPPEETKLAAESKAPSDGPSEGAANDNNNIEFPPLGVTSSQAKKGAGRSRSMELSLIEEGCESEQQFSISSKTGEGAGTIPKVHPPNDDGKANGEPDAAQTSTTGARINQSKLFEIFESFRGGAKPQPQAHGVDSRDVDDLHSVLSDPGPNHSWRGEAAPSASGAGPPSPPPGPRMRALKREFTQNFKNNVERYREDHVLHNRIIIPSDDWETIKGAERVGDNVMRLASSLNLGAMQTSTTGTGGLLDPSRDDVSERNMSEKELLDFMTKCLESRDVETLDFMADFFRDETISQTMVKSKAQVVWLQDWFPIKDCIYAISVDVKKKRVLVVFRGAITRADWNHGFDAAMKKAHNPVKDAYKGKKALLKIHRGFYTYMFRTRKDTSTRKYDEIANKVFHYGNQMIGSDFTVTVNGYSLGGALSTLFGFYASTDERFTKNGPVKIFSYGSPYVGGHFFADAFRHQEREKKLQHARFYNHNDIVAHLPFNLKPTKRGSNFVHVGVDVKIYPVPGVASLRGTRTPAYRHNDRQSPSAAYCRALRMNSLLNMALPWRIKDQHGLPELQKRVAWASKKDSVARTLDEIYEDMVYKKGA